MLHPRDLLDQAQFTPRQEGQSVVVTNNTTGLDVARVANGYAQQARMVGPDQICTCGEC
jgi:hypothetical protein